MQFSIIPDYEEIEASLELAKEFGVHFEYNDFTLPKVYENPKEIQERICFYKNLPRDRKGDTMHGAFLGIDLAAIDPVFQQRSKALLCQSLSIARQLEIRGVVFHTGLIGSLRLESYLSHWLEESEIFWKNQCACYPNLEIYLENSFEQEPNALVALAKRMEGVPNFKLCFDYGHAILTKTPIEIWQKELTPYIGHMHVNDNDLKDDLHLVPGEGKIDFAEFQNWALREKLDVTMLLELNGAKKQRDALLYMKGL